MEPTSQVRECAAPVYWWEGEYDMACELPEGHDGPHFDGLSWFNDENEPVDDPTEQPSA
jgi:hypothetical protein